MHESHSPHKAAKTTRHLLGAVLHAAAAIARLYVDPGVVADAPGLQRRTWCREGDVLLVDNRRIGPWESPVVPGRCPGRVGCEPHLDLNRWKCAGWNPTVIVTRQGLDVATPSRRRDLMVRGSAILAIAARKSPRFIASKNSTEAFAFCMNGSAGGGAVQSPCDHQTILANLKFTH
jgi:hypothetical protein